MAGGSRDFAAQVLDEGSAMEALTKDEAEAFTRISFYSVDDVRFAWKYWRDAGDQAGFEAFVRRRIAESSNARIRRSIEHGRRMAA